MECRGKIIVFGSLNADIVVRIPRLPAPGETVGGGAMSLVSGGKGANQAVALSKLGWPVSMIGRVGTDSYGTFLRETLASSGVDISNVKATDEDTGIALITVDDGGQNTIALVSGANGKCSPEDAEILGELGPDDIVLLQLEVPKAAVKAAAAKAKAAGALVVLNAAPYFDWAADIIPQIDWLIVNETEAGQLLGVEVTDDKDSAFEAFRLFKDKYGEPKGGVVITLGGKGSVVYAGGRSIMIEAYPIEPVDTTASGDAFVGCLTGLLSSGMADPEKLLRVSNAVGALTATRPGAQTSLPSRVDLEKFLAARGQKLD